MHLDIDPDIRRARTPPAWLYRDAQVHAELRARALAASWQLLPEAAQLAAPVRAVPCTLLPGSLDEPLLLTHADDGALRCLANVCTHRANILLDAPSTANAVRCGYHGRRFALDGTLLHMPEFEGALDFPGADDNLRAYRCETLGPLTFVALADCQPLAAQLGDLRTRLDFLPWARMQLVPESARAFTFDANWLLYLENYLEGFHIPFVHPTLARAVDFATYETALYPWASVQIATAVGDDPHFAAPLGHCDHGRRVAAYYAWLWPNTMLNLYPWGCSANIVQPLGMERTRVVFLDYVAEPALRARGAGSGLEQVELEDEAIVRRVQRGVRAHGYTRGRYSPTRELGVHHLHRLLARVLAR